MSRLAHILTCFLTGGLCCLAQVSQDQVSRHAAAAQEAQARHDFVSAIREYGWLSRVLPPNAQVESNLGVALYFHNESAAAIAALRKAQAMDPNLLAPHLFSGLAWYRLSNTEAAAKELEAAVRLNDSDTIAHTYLGYVYTDEKRYDAALEQFELVLRTDPNNLDVLYALGKCNLEIGRRATAQLLAIKPDGARVWQLAGEQSLLRGDRARALSLFDEALRRRSDLSDVRAAVTALRGNTPVGTASPSNASEHKEDELYQLAHNSEENARQAFEQISRVAPDSYRAHQVLADSLAAQQRWDDAAAEYRTVIARKPDLPGIHQAIGEALLHSAKTEDALREFKAELAMEPNSSVAHVSAARALLLLGDDARAEKLLGEALKLSQPPNQAYKLLGKLAVRQHEYATAIALLSRYCRQVQDDAGAYYLLMQAYRATGNSAAMQTAAGKYHMLSQDARDRTNAQRALRRQDENSDEMTSNEEAVSR